jgi:hypothetical protein
MPTTTAPRLLSDDDLAAMLDLVEEADADESKAFLTERGVELTGDQQTKTKTALDYFTDNAAKA